MSQLSWFLAAHPNEVIEAYAEDGSLHETIAQQVESLQKELEMAADTFRDFGNVLRVLGKDTMSAAAGVAERHIREQLESSRLTRATR